MKPRELAKRWFEEVWNGRNAGLIHEMMDPQAVGYTKGGVVTGPGQFEEQMFRPLLAAFPDLHITIESCLEEGDEAVTRWTLAATHQGPQLGVPATGRRISASGITWLRFKDGRLVEGWDRWNLHGLLAMLAGGAPSVTSRWAE